MGTEKGYKRTGLSSVGPRAEVGDDGDGFDGDELALPVVLGLAVLAVLGWKAFQHRSKKSPR